MNPEQLLDFVMHRKWVSLAAVAIAITVRILKSDTKIPIDVPPKLRVWLALVLGAVAGVLDKIAEGGDTTWTSAIVQGLTAAVLAIVSHNMFIASLNSGRELNVPGLILPNTPPGPNKPPSLPPAEPNLAKAIKIAADEAKASQAKEAKGGGQAS